MDFYRKDYFASADTEGFAASFGSMASAFGNNVWQIVALVIGIIILMFGVGRGIEKANKIMMPVFFILFAVLGIYVAFQPLWCNRRLQIHFQS